MLQSHFRTLLLTVFIVVVPFTVFAQTTGAVSFYRAIAVVPAGTSATFDWSTVYHSTAVIEYGTSLSYGFTALDDSGAREALVPIQGLVPGTQYYYRVTITESDGTGYTQAFTGTFTTTGGTPPPPTGDTQSPTTPVGLSLQVVSQSQINLTWNASTDNVGVVAYRIYRDGNLLTTVTTPTYQNSGLLASTNYTYTVQALDAAGNQSSQSVAVSGITQAPPAPDTTSPSTPTNLTVTPISSTQLNLSWTAATDNVGVTGYRIYRGGSLITTVTGTTYQNTGLTANTAYNYSVSAYDAAGNNSGQTGSVSATTQNAPVTPPAGIVFSDNFEYTVGRNDVNVTQLFQGHGWSDVKSQQSRPGSSGYVYTTNAISGYSGQFPGGGSSVLAIEALPQTFGGQTDFYLQYGNGEGPVGQIPADHWVQFWVYSEHTPEHPSYITSQGKFLYYNRATYYPATLGNEGYVFLVNLHDNSHSPLNTDPCAAPSEEFVCDRGFFTTGWESGSEPGLVHGNVNNHIEYSNSSLGANLSTAPHVVPNGWTLVKMHFDLTGTNPRALPGQAVYEQWIKRAGDTNWTKTTENIGGVTQINGQTLDFYPRYNDGFRMLRIPTTIGSSAYPQDTRDNTRNYWLYLDDFAMARSEAALPTYGVTPPPAGDATPPSVPTNLTVTPISSTQLNLSWTAATDNVGVTGYRIYRGGSLITTVTGTTYQNTGLTANTAYNYSVSAYDAAGNNSGQSGSVSGTTQVGAVTPPAGIVFSDNFEYTISRASDTANSTFMTHGWSGVRTEGSTWACTAGGYLYTMMNALLGSNVLVMESLPNNCPPPGGFTYGQTDYYLQVSNGSEVVVPPNAWFQFWTYATPESQFAPRDKTLYACRTSYPCTEGQWSWLFMWGRQGLEYAIDLDQLGPAQNRFLSVQTETSDNRNAPEYPSGARFLYQNLSRSNLVAGRWFQVKMHMDVSGPEGVWEAWIREQGQSQWTKVAEWIGGVTPNFNWPIPAAQRVGHRMLRTPTTVNGNYGNSTTYMDDFVIATAESALPTGGAPTPVSPPTPDTTTRFTTGARIQTSANINVRATANTTGTLLGTQSTGILGTVVGGPVAQGGYNWWNVNYDSGTDGWSVEDFLNVYTPPAPDTTAPSTPTNLTATAVSQTQINLSWTASTDAVGVTGYRIYRTGTLLTTVTGTSYSNTGLTANTAYNYTVQAIDAAGNSSAQTSSVSGTTPAALVVITPPANPTPPSSGGGGGSTPSPTPSPTGGGTGLAQRLTADGAPNQVIISWKNPTDTSFATVRLYRDNTLIYSGTREHVTDIGVTGTSPHTYTISFLNSSDTVLFTQSDTATLNEKLLANVLRDQGLSQIPVGVGALASTPNAPLTTDLTPLTKRLILGATGEEVKTLQTLLLVPVTGSFDQGTLTALQTFQRTNGIVSSGTPDTTGYGSTGPSTRAALNKRIPAKVTTVTPGKGITISKTLSRGSKGVEVTLLQTYLILKGYLTGTATGYLGPLTERAVKAFQKANNLEQVGWVGKMTRAALLKG